MRLVEGQQITNKSPLFKGNVRQSFMATTSVEKKAQLYQMVLGL
jgi:hypothetical protein